MNRILILLVIFSSFTFGEIQIKKEKTILNKFKPTSITADSSGNLYVGSNFTNEVVKYNEKFKYKYTLRFKESSNIMDIFVYKDSIYLLLLGGQIIELDLEGNLKRELSFPKGKLLGELDSPKGIYIDNEGFHIADTGNSRVVIMDFDGKNIRSFGYKTKSLDGFVSPVSINKIGQYFIISDESTREIKLMDKVGFYSGNFRNDKKEVNFSISPSSVVVDKDNNVYIADSGKNQLVIFTADGKIRSVGERGSSDNKFLGPRDIWVDNNYIYVADTMNEKVKILERDGYKVIKVLGKNTLRSYILYAMIGLGLITFVIFGKIKSRKGEEFE